MNQRYCTQCGTMLPEKGNFCPQCGAPIEGATAPPASPPPVKPSAQPYVQPAVQRETSGKKPNASRTVLFVLGGVAVIAVLTMVAYFAFLRPAGVDQVTIADVHDEQGIPYPDVARISVAEASARFEDGSAVFVDVRDRDSYTAAHVPNAVWMPLTDLNARYAELPRDVQILTYCT